MTASVGGVYSVRTFGRWASDPGTLPLVAPYTTLHACISRGSIHWLLTTASPASSGTACVLCDTLCQALLVELCMEDCRGRLTPLDLSTAASWHALPSCRLTGCQPTTPIQGTECTQLW